MSNVFKPQRIFIIIFYIAYLYSFGSTIAQITAKVDHKKLKREKKKMNKK